MSYNNDNQVNIGHGLVVVAVAVLCLIFGLSMARRLDRMIVIAEKMDSRLEKAIDALAPAGKAIVQKSVETISQVDSKDLAESTTKGVKEVGKSLKDRFKENYGPKNTTTKSSDSSN